MFRPQLNKSLNYKTCFYNQFVTFETKPRMFNFLCGWDLYWKTNETQLKVQMLKDSQKPDRLILRKKYFKIFYTGKSDFISFSKELNSKIFM